MLTVIATNTSSKRLAQFPTYANLLLHDTVDDALDYGHDYMTSIVPRGTTSRLANSIKRSGPIVAAPGHFIGTVSVDPSIAPHADKVDRGTGVDGPYRQPVTIFGARQRNGRRHVMRFVKQGEEPRYRTTVKARPSTKIERSKNFSGRTFDAMTDWLRVRTTVLTARLAIYFARPSK